MRQTAGRKLCWKLRRRDDLAENHKSGSINDLKIVEKYI
jgi:hypothetical protein